MLKLPSYRSQSIDLFCKCKTAKILAFNDLNGVNIMKATRAVGFMKPLIGLIFFSIENLLILLLSCYVKYQIKIIMRKKKKTAT